MPIHSSIYIKGSVGRGGRNDRADVAAIQRRLNDLMNPPRKMLAVDGRSGPMTEAMIADFQSGVLNFRRPDRRVDPMGKTIRALNDPASANVWARMSIGTPALPDEADERPDPRAAGLDELQLSRLEALYEKASELGLDHASAALDDLVENEVAVLKNILNAQGVVQYTTEFVQGLANLRRAGISARNIANTFRMRALHRTLTVDELIAFTRRMGHAPRLDAALKRIGLAANVLGIMIVTVEAFNHFQNGRIGAGMAEIWGAAMSTAIPWAGALNAVQSIGYAIFPGMSGNSKVETAFAVLNAIDPVGASQAGVDAYYTVIQTIGEWIWTGKLNMGNLQQFTDRLENSPMRLWTPLGNDIGDWLGENFGQWTYETFLK